MKIPYIACFALVLNAHAWAAEPAFSGSVAFESDYVFRGGAQFSGPAYQPGFEVSYPFECPCSASTSVTEIYGGYWGSYPVDGKEGFEESDVFAGVRVPLEPLTFDAGFTYYGFNVDSGSNRWHELYFGVSADGLIPGTFALSPSLYTYYNFSGKAWTVEGALAHSFALDKLLEGLALDTGVHLAGVHFDDADGDQIPGGSHDGYVYWGATADLVYPLSENVSLSAGVRYAGNNNHTSVESGKGVNLYTFSNESDLLWWGASTSVSF